MLAKRDDVISVSKAYGILLMVLAHAGLSTICQHVVYMFHMPLFFFYAGYCFNEEYTKNIKTFIKKRIKKLYFPFLFWSLLFLVTHNIFFMIGIYSSKYGYNNEVSYLYDYNDYVSRFFYITLLMSKFEQLVGGYWFIRELFLTSIIGCLLLKYFNNFWIVLIVITLTMVFSIMNYFDIVPFILQLTLLSISFFLIGFYFKKKEVFQYKKVYLFVSLCVICLLLCTYCSPTSMLTFSANNLIPYILAAISGIYLTHFISTKTPSVLKKYLVYIGDHSFTILTLHFLSFKVVSFVYTIYYGLEHIRISEFPIISDAKGYIWVFSYFAIGVILPLGYTKIVTFINNKWLYILK